ncbi:MAG: class I SAM-dependent methyltransferase [Myxococcota bacterium]
MHDPVHEAARWNLSPERLYLDCWTRLMLRETVDPADAASTCNVGIGVGEWDDWLGFWLEGYGSLLSVDIDLAQVRGLAERQQAQGHPNPAQVRQGDLLQSDLGAHDLVTVVGSTLHETHAPARALACARKAVRPGGLLYVSVLHGLGDPVRLLADQAGVVEQRTYDALPEAGITLALIRVREG